MGLLFDISIVCQLFMFVFGFAWASGCFGWGFGFFVFASFLVFLRVVSGFLHFVFLWRV